MIFNSIKDLKCYLDTNQIFEFVCTSCPCDPIHIGHVRCLLDSKYYSQNFIVIVNDDNFLIRKKGYFFMPLLERMEIIHAIKGVSHVVSWSEDSVAEALRFLRPKYFTKGGDRSSPDCICEKELKICEEINCKIIYGVGGSKKNQSSSNLVNRICSLKKEMDNSKNSINQK